MSASRPDVSHLRPHRRVVIAHSILSGVAGLVPVPVVDDYLAETARARLIRRLAAGRNLLLEPKALRALAAEHDAPGWRRIATATGLLAASRRRFRKLFFAVVFTERADDIARTFILGTLFDHYLHRHHPEGTGLLAVDRAQRVRALIDLAGGGLRRTLVRQAVERAGKRLSAAATRVPEALGDLLTRLRQRGDATPTDPVAGASDAVVDDPALRAAGEAAEEELAGGGEGLLVALVESFEQTVTAAGGFVAGPPPAPAPPTGASPAS